MATSTTITLAERPAWLQDVARDLPPMMGVEQVATVLCVHPQTVRKWIADRSLPAVRSVPGAGSSRVIVSRAAVLDWLAARATV